MEITNKIIINKWYSLSRQERDDLLGSIGGCGNCRWWDHSLHYPIMGRREVGCTYHTRTRSTMTRQISDNGCVCHTKLKDTLISLINKTEDL